jgi:hypothetical protein
MKSPLPYILGAAGGALLLITALPAPSQGQTADEATALGLAIDDLVQQQATLIENQAKIDEKIAAISEEVRQARLFVARGGGSRK